MVCHEGFAGGLKKMGSGVPGCQCRPEPAGWPGRPACVAATQPLWLPHRGHVHGHGHGHGTGRARAVHRKSGGTAGPDSHRHTPKIATPRCGGMTHKLSLIHI